MKKQQLFTLVAAAVSTAALTGCGFADQKDIRLSGQHTISFMGQETQVNDMPVDCDAEGVYLPQTEDDPYVDRTMDQDYQQVFDVAEQYDLPVEQGEALTYSTYQEHRSEFHTVLTRKVVEQGESLDSPMAQTMVRNILPGMFDSIAAQVNEIVSKTCDKPKQG